MTRLGVVIVTYNAADVIGDCLHSLLASLQAMRVVVVDNASTDGTSQLVEALSNRPGLPQIHLIRAPQNGGFAAGVNIGLNHLLYDSCIDRVWILNPDTRVPEGTPKAIAAEPLDFDLMGMRVVYADPPHLIQIDAGTINWWTGVTGNLNIGKTKDVAPPTEAQIDFISGASLIASRSFIERAGPMPEGYFLYYEEVDWAQKAKRPFKLCKSAYVYHLAGSTIGSPSLNTPASVVSVYYKHRARMRFLRKFNPMALPMGYAYGIAKALQHVAQGQKPQAYAVLRALHGKELSADIAAHPRHQTLKRGA